MSTFLKTKQEFDIKYSGEAEIASFVPVHTTPNRKCNNEPRPRQASGYLSLPYISVTTPRYICS